MKIIEIVNKYICLFRFRVVAAIFCSGKIQMASKRTFLEKGGEMQALGKGKLEFAGRVEIRKHAVLRTSGQLSIGKDFFLNSYSRIVAHESVQIGDNVTIAQFVSILDHDHEFEFVDTQMVMNGFKTSAVVIGNNVWIGDKVTILRGVTVGNNVIIAANSVVKDDVPSGSLVAGVPVKIIKALNETENSSKQ